MTTASLKQDYSIVDDVWCRELDVLHAILDSTKGGHQGAEEFFANLSRHCEYRNGSPLISQLPAALKVVEEVELSSEPVCWWDVHNAIKNAIDSNEPFYGFKRSGLHFLVVSLHRLKKTKEKLSQFILDINCLDLECVGPKIVVLEKTASPDAPHFNNSLRARQHLVVVSVPTAPFPRPESLVLRFKERQLLMDRIISAQQDVIVAKQEVVDVSKRRDKVENMCKDLSDDDVQNVNEQLGKAHEHHRKTRDAKREKLLKLLGVPKIDRVIFLFDLGDDPSFPITVPLERLRYAKGRVDRSNIVIDNGPLVLAGDSYERNQWSQFFYKMLEEQRANTEGSKAEQVKMYNYKSWQLFCTRDADATCFICEKKHTLTFGTGKSYDRAHISPALWGAMDDKYWWNIVPTCRGCNRGQGGDQETNRDPTCALDEDSGAHMFSDLMNKGKFDKIRSICMLVLEALLGCPERKYVCHIPITPFTLLSFCFGFYTLPFDPLETVCNDNRWKELILTATEIDDLKAIAEGPLNVWRQPA